MEKIMDLMYFGYEHESDSRKLEKDFIKEFKEKFDNAELKDAFDSIKGHRQEVYIDKNQKDEYQTWLIGRGWFEMSLNMQLLMMDSSQKEEFKRVFELTKIQYPEAFKKECVGK